MELTKEAIEKRIQDLAAMYQQHEAAAAQHGKQALACMGAIEDCKHWLSVIDHPLSPEEVGEMVGAEVVGFEKKDKPSKAAKG